MTPLFDEPPAGLTAFSNTWSSGVHLAMAVMAIVFTNSRRRVAVGALAGMGLGAGAVMHFLGGLSDLADARWVMIARTAASPVIVVGWYRLLKAAAESDRRQERTEKAVAAAASGPATLRLIDARELLETIQTPTDLKKRA